MIAGIDHRTGYRASRRRRCDGPGPELGNPASDVGFLACHSRRVPRSDHEAQVIIRMQPATAAGRHVQRQEPGPDVAAAELQAGRHDALRERKIQPIGQAMPMVADFHLGSLTLPGRGRRAIRPVRIRTSRSGPRASSRRPLRPPSHQASSTPVAMPAGTPAQRSGSSCRSVPASSRAAAGMASSNPVQNTRFAGPMASPWSIGLSGRRCASGPGPGRRPDNCQQPAAAAQQGRGQGESPWPPPGQPANGGPHDGRDDRYRPEDQ